MREIRTSRPRCWELRRALTFAATRRRLHHSDEAERAARKIAFPDEGKVKPPNPSDKKAWKRFVDEEYTPARNAVWEREGRVREGEIPGDSTTFRDFDVH